jgi:hypothetical protein
MRFLLSIVVILGLSGPGLAQGSEIRQTISDQIAALQKDDFGTAFTFASPMIQGMFGTPERFGAMVMNGYPMVWRPSSVEYGKIITENGKTVQPVFLKDQAGVDYVARYEMIQLPDGRWKINGVWIERPAGTGA